MSRDVLRGWRFFECEDCGAHWKETCRDHATPSSSQCINKECPSIYQGGIPPYYCITDLTLASDGHGNLHRNSNASIELIPRWLMRQTIKKAESVYELGELPDEPA